MYYRITCSIFFLLATLTVSGQQADTNSLFNELLDRNIIEITLRTDIQQLLDNRKKEIYQDAMFEYMDAEGIARNYEIKIRVRGKFRRRICDFPPIKLNLDKDRLEEQGYTDHDKFKLVTHCIDEKKVGNQNVLKEYLCYQIYEQLTDKSFRTKLIKLNYVDTEGNYPEPIERYAFMIESIRELADRLGGEECEDCLNQPRERFEPKNEATVAMFQYMIGNEDWSTTMARNMKLIRYGKDSTQPYTIVPYDFDFSGLVNTSYAIPSADHGLSSITERAYLGFSLSPEQIKATKNLFRSKKKDIINMIKDFDQLSGASRRFCIDYVRDFYVNLDQMPIPERSQRQESLDQR